MTPSGTASFSSIGEPVRQHVEVVPASFELETHPDVTGYTELWLAREEHSLVAAMESAAFPDETARVRFRAEIDRYLRQLESAIFDRTDSLLPLRQITPFRLAVRNLGDRTIHGVQLVVRLHVHGQEQLIQADLDEALLTELPARPTPPGSANVDPAAHQRWLRARQRRQQRRDELSELTRQSPQDFEVGVSNVVRPATLIATSQDERLIELVYPTFDLRVGQELELPHVALDLLEPLDVVCPVEWTVTAAGLVGIQQGRFEMTTVAHPFALARTWPSDYPAMPAPNLRRPDGKQGVDDGTAEPGTDGLQAICGILDHVNPFLVAAVGELPSTKLRLRLVAVAEELGALDDDALDDPESLIARLTGKYSVPATAYHAKPVVVDECDYQQEVRGWSNQGRMDRKPMRDYTVAVDFDGDADLVRASLAMCTHEPRWQVRGNQIHTVFAVERTAPADDLRRRIDERVADARQHLQQTRADLDHYHDQLDALLAEMVPKLVAIRSAGERQREELGLRFAAAPEVSPTALPQSGRAMLTTLGRADVEIDAVFQQVIGVLQLAAAGLPADTAFVEALKSEDLLRSLLVACLNAGLRAEYTVTAEALRGQGKTDISVYWQRRLICIVECKIWYSESKFKDGIDQLLSYLTHGDTRAVYVVFIRQHDATRIIDTLKQAMHGHDNCDDVDLPAGHDRVDFSFHATGDVEQQISMVLLPVPLSTSATGGSADRGLRRVRRTRATDPDIVGPSSHRAVDET